MTEQFVLDRRRGREGQDYVAGMFESWGLRVENVPDGFFQDYDLLVYGKDGRPHTVEVKYDIRSRGTGRFCLELDALWHSRAELLAIVTDNPKTVYLTPLQEALRLAQGWPIKKAVGERNEVAALVPIKQFISKLSPQILTTN